MHIFGFMIPKSLQEKTRAEIIKTALHYAPKAQYFIITKFFPICFCFGSLPEVNKVNTGNAVYNTKGENIIPATLNPIHNSTLNPIHNSTLNPIHNSTPREGL